MTIFDLFLSAIRLTYGDLNSPDYSAVTSILDTHPQASLVEKLRALGIDVTETTDTNYDVSTQLSLQVNGQRAALEISAVGPFAVLREIDAAGRSTWVTLIAEASGSLAKQLVAEMDGAHLILVSRDTALTRVPMRGDAEGEHATLYAALFSCAGLIP